MSDALTSAVILAAGQGTRLGRDGGGQPKGFLRLGERPIIEESVLRLASQGITDVIIVTGFAASRYEELARAYPSLIRTVHNPEFSRSGSMYSLHCARTATDGPFLLLESDIIYETRALQVLLEQPMPDAILLSGPTAAGDEVFVETRDGNLVAMSKDRATLGSAIAGELVGISRISHDLFALMQRVAAAAFRTSLAWDYETDCLVAAARERPIACPVVPDLVWAEIDEPGHLRRAIEQVYPKLRFTEGTG